MVALLCKRVGAFIPVGDPFRGQIVGAWSARLRTLPQPPLRPSSRIASNRGPAHQTPAPAVCPPSRAARQPRRAGGWACSADIDLSGTRGRDRWLTELRLLGTLQRPTARTAPLPARPPLRAAGRFRSGRGPS